MPYAFTWRFFSALLMLACFAAPVRAGEYEAYDPALTGILHVARPIITWKVWGIKGTRLTQAEVTLNGIAVPCIYSEERRVLRCQPARALAPGAYTVRCHVVFDGNWPVEKTWQFTVADDAVPELPAPSPAQQALCQAVNFLRRQMDLPPFPLDARLCLAASRHCLYLERNQDEGHEEAADRPNFLGHGPQERVLAYGYTEGIYENIDYVRNPAPDSVARFVDGPYHRIPFMQPGSPEFGAGLLGEKTTLEIGSSESEGTVVYPTEGQTGVPLAWSGQETPNPIRLHPSAIGPFGYVITYTHFSASQKTLHVLGVSLTTLDGMNVPCYVNTPANDTMLMNAALLIPRHALSPGTTYQVSVTAFSGAEDVSRRWRFTTALAPRAPLELVDIPSEHSGIARHAHR